jgi:BirA family biotin operon repressor/biotin-[acetyl-CoA-carboxylase] ligase
MGVISFDTLQSTNTYAKENIASLKHNDIVTARRQTDGRGRKQRSWHSPQGGLYFSLILKPDLTEPDLASTFTQLMALGVLAAVKKAGASVYIKWPNDILSGGKKLCGILSEAVFENNSLKGIIIGVGINVSQTEIKSDKPAVTLSELGVETDSKTLLREVSGNFKTYYSRLLEGGYKLIRPEYKENFPYLGKEITIKTGQREIKGIAHDIDERGRLIIKTENGLITISAGDMDF